MIKNIVTILLFCIAFSACKPDKNPFVSLDDRVDLRDEEEHMIGIWQEFGAIAYYLDSLGNPIDSTDLNSIYEFKSDLTFTSQNDIYTKATSGTWRLDSFDNKINLYPYYGDSPYLYRKDAWEIDHEPPYLNIGHSYDVVLPSGSYGVYRKRTFIKVN